MKELDIEWRHYSKDGATCLRCSGTGANLAEAVAALTNDLARHGIRVSYRETLLPEQDMPQSNLILFNGIPLEQVLEGAASESSCDSCSCLSGSQTVCRTVELEGMVYEEIPEELIRRAAYKVTGIAEETADA